MPSRSVPAILTMCWNSFDVDMYLRVRLLYWAIYEDKGFLFKLCFVYVVWAGLEFSKEEGDNRLVSSSSFSSRLSMSV